MYARVRVSGLRVSAPCHRQDAWCAFMGVGRMLVRVYGRRVYGLVRVCGLRVYGLVRVYGLRADAC